MGKLQACQQQLNNECNNKSHKHGGDACCPSGLSYFNFVSINSSDHRIAWGKARQQRNNNATTTQQQRNNKTHKHGQGLLCSSVSFWRHLASSGVICHLASSGVIWRHLASSGLIWPHLASSGASDLGESNFQKKIRWSQTSQFLYVK